MTLEHLEKAAAKAWKDLRRAEAKAEERQREVQAAKAQAKPLTPKRAQSVERLQRAVRAALAAEGHVRDLLRACEQAQQRLARAMRKTARAEVRKDTRSPSPTAKRRNTARLRGPQTASLPLRSRSSVSRATARPDRP